MSDTTPIGSGDEVVYQIALNEHPLTTKHTAKEIPDEQLIESVEQRTHVLSDDLTWPEWAVFESNPPDAPLIRYVNTDTKINVKAYEGMGAHKKRRDVCDELVERIEIDEFEIENAPMSYWTTHADDFEGDVHLDLTYEQCPHPSIDWDWGEVRPAREYCIVPGLCQSCDRQVERVYDFDEVTER